MNDTDIISKYSPIIDAYFLECQKGLNEYISRNNEKYDFILRRLIRFYFFTNYISSLKMPAKGDEKILFVFFTKSSLNLLAIYHLLRNGMEVESAILLRGIFDNLINLELILKENTENRIKLFVDFMHIERKNQLEEHKKLIEKGYYEDLPVDNEYIEGLTKAYEKVRDNYHPKRPIHWAWKIFSKSNKNNPSLKSICEHLGKEYEIDYLRCFSTFSKSVHSSATSESYYSRQDNNENIILNSPNFTDSVHHFSAIAMDYVGKIAIKILNYFKPENYDEIIRFLEISVSDALNAKENE